MKLRKKLIEVALPLEAINQASGRELVYQLYTLCERKNRAGEALSYNALVQSWPEIARLARENSMPHAVQAIMFGGDEV